MRAFIDDEKIRLIIKKYSNITYYRNLCIPLIRHLYYRSASLPMVNDGQGGQVGVAKAAAKPA